jgi:poly(hydroxyalkanoate) depolymerase family esterase
MLHGCNQTPDDFAIGTHMNAIAEKHGLALAYPRQTKRQNLRSCWNWFKPRNQMRGSGEPAILAALTRNLMREFGLGRADVFVAGLSAGGAMATILADVYPDVFAAAGVHSGLARGAAWDPLSAMSAMHNGGAHNGVAAGVTNRAGPVRRIIFQGADDCTVNPVNAGYIVTAEIGRDVVPAKVSKRSVRGRDYSRSFYTDPKGVVLIELWMIEGSGHAWSGGRAAGSYTDTKGPDASAQMVRFFLDKPA